MASQNETTLNQIREAYRYFQQYSNLYNEQNQLIQQINKYRPRFIRSALIAAVETVLYVQLFSAIHIPILSDIIFTPYLILAIIANYVRVIIMRNRAINVEVGKQQAQLDAVRQKLHEAYHAYHQNPPLAYEYCHPNTINQLFDFVRLGRADTLKEAINIYHDDLHKAAVLESQQQIYQQAERAAKAAEWEPL